MNTEDCDYFDMDDIDNPPERTRFEKFKLWFDWMMYPQPWFGRWAISRVHECIEKKCTGYLGKIIHKQITPSEMVRFRLWSKFEFWLRNHIDRHR